MPKFFLGRFFLLSFVLLFSCDNNNNCIDADDFGNVQKNIINVSASLSGICYNNIKLDSYKNDYSDIVPISSQKPDSETSPKVKKNALSDCLIKQDLTLITDSDIKALVAGMPTYTKSEKKGCLRIMDTLERRVCENICELWCEKQNSGLIDDPNSVNNIMTWKANAPRKQDSSDGIDITPDSKIFVNVEGEVNFDKTYGIDQTLTYTPSIGLDLFEGNKLVKLEFSGNYGTFNTESYYNNTPTVVTISEMQGLARRSLFFFTPTSETNPDIEISTADINRVKNGLEEISLLSSNDDGIITHSSLKDGLINFKKDENADCKNANIDVSIKNKDSDVYYRVTNLKLSTGSYTTKNIPAYSDAKLVIQVKNFTQSSAQSLNPTSCSIKMQTQKYLDIPIKNSGIAQFKAKNSGCTLYSRIINPEAEKISYPLTTTGEKVGISHDADKDIAFIVSRDMGFTKSNPLGAGLAYKVKNVYIGLNTYANKDHADLANSSCRQQQNFLNCKIESSSCSITSNDMSQAINPNGCNNGSGIDGSISPNKAGNGGGGGGNGAGLAGSYNTENNAGGSGTHGESYINPEFQLGTIDTVRPSSSSIGNGAPLSITPKGVNGRVRLWLEGETPKIYETDTADLTFGIPKDNTKKLNYEIYGGGGGAGGAGGSCDENLKGGSGENGDYFKGELDVSSSAQKSALTLKIQVGSGGYSGKNCGESLDSQSNKSKNLDANKKLKGGNGGINNENVASGGAGGSASYVSLVRSDETDDTTREDFLVIAGGGGGGGGSDGLINGYMASSTYNRDNINKLVSSANGLRLAVALEAIPNMTLDFSSDYYEYDDFFTKTVLSSEDPLKNIDVTSTYDKGFFVRKGQVLRILPKSFENNKCGEGMSIKITPRPAVFCLGGIAEPGFKNPNCLPYLPNIGNVDVTEEVRVKREGCAPTSTCDIVAQTDYCPDSASCSVINCDTKGSETTANTGCKRAAPSSSCPSGEGCVNCSNKKITQMQLPPLINLDTSICYSSENTKTSVNNVLKKYNDATTTLDEKNKLVKNFTEIKDYDNNAKFGNFNNYKKSPQNQAYFETKDSISFGPGKIKSFLIKNNNFADITKIAYKDANGNYNISDRENIPTDSTISGKSEITVKIVDTKIQQKGRSLQVALCEENIADITKGCNSTEPNILAYFINDPENEASNAFKFNSFGILERVKALPTQASGISDCPGMGVGDNFICYSFDKKQSTTEEHAKKIEKHRLIFRIKDLDNDYSNNAGEYNIKAEKKDAATRPGSDGLVNGILQPIIDNLDGVADNKATTDDETKPGIVRNFYKALISNPLYRTTLTLTIVLALSFYGMGFLMGVNELKHSEVVKILFKIGFIYLFTSTETGWSWFNKFFVETFKNATDYISFSVAETFDYENSDALMTKIINNDFHDRGVLFKSVDGVIDLILAGAVQKKIMALLFSSIFGWLYFLILYYCLFTYVYAVANSMLLYITCQIIISILFVLGPIFFIFLMFKVTKDMFDNWLKALIGFSLQQIFLVMTLALFNSFVVGFLKLALGYRICWTNILSLNLYFNRITLLNFWTVAGTNTPENSIEDSPDEYFGNEQNMPSIYLFLYLMIIVSLMGKFVELFTNLAVAIAGGLKASTIAADAASMGNRIFNAASSGISAIYQKTAGRAVANIDNSLFDSGILASNRRKAEREQFTKDVKTSVMLNLEGNKAVSEYKKNNALKLSEMGVDEQKEVLRGEKQKAIKSYADSNGISSKEIDRITNASGLNYSGNNLIGMAFQAGKQAVIPGGRLISSMNDKKIDASFSKKEANSALKRMKSDESTMPDGSKMNADEKRSKFIEAIEKGNVHVNKGSIENARKMAITSVKAPVKALFNPKATLVAVATTAGSAVYSGSAAVAKRTPKFGAKSKLKNEVTKNLEDTGKITKNNKDLFYLLPKFLQNPIKELARTPEEKNIIKEAVREKSIQGKVNLPKATSSSVIRDLKTTQEYIRNTEKKTGVEFSNNKSPTAMAERAGGRMKNLFTPGEGLVEKSKRATTMNQENFKKNDNFAKDLKKSREENIQERDSLIANDLKRAKDSISNDPKTKTGEIYKKFAILEEAKNSIIEKENSTWKSNKLIGKEAFLTDDIKDKMTKNGMGDIYDAISNPYRPMGLFDLGGLPSKKQLNEYLDKVIESHVSKNPELNEIRENRNKAKEIGLNIKESEKKEAKINKEQEFSKKAQIINEANIKIVENFKKKHAMVRGGLAIASKATSILTLRPIARNANSLATKVTGAFNAIRGKEISDEKVVSSYLSPLAEREKFKKATKAIRAYNEIERKNGGYEKFVIDNEKTYKSAPSKELNNDSLVGGPIPALAPNNPEGPVNV